MNTAPDDTSFNDQWGNAKLSIQRLTALSDGIFAVAMTLLVFTVRLPEQAADIRVDQVIALWPKLLSYALSFIVLGMYWISHHNIVNLIRRSNRVFLWLNLLFLMCIAFIPFEAATLGEHGQQRLVIILYGGTLIVTSSVLELLHWYAIGHHRLIDTPRDIRLATIRGLLPAMICLVAIEVSFIIPILSVVLYVLVPIIYIAPSRVDRYWAHRN